MGRMVMLWIGMMCKWFGCSPAMDDFFLSFFLFLVLNAVRSAK